MPVTIEDGQPKTSVITFYINYFTDCMVYELPYHKTFEIDNRLIYDSVKYEYLICNKSGSAGCLFKSLSDSSFTRVNSDSVLKLRAYGQFHDMVDVFKEVKPLSIQSKTGSGEIVIWRYLFHHYFYDSAYLCYNATLKDIPFSFSPTLDSVNNSKLVQIQFFIKHEQPDTNIELRDFFINSFEIKDERITEIEEKTQLIKICMRQGKFPGSQR